MKNLKNKITKKMGKFVCAVAAMVGAFNMTGVAYASGSGNATIKSVLEKMINNVICPVFVAIGVILSVYSVGQLVLAFKNEDADSKSRASTMLVVGIVLIAIPSLITGLGLLDNVLN